jgi:putative oxidoreductase
MRVLYSKFVGILELIPLALIAVLARFSVGMVFVKSGITKIEGWADGGTFALFEQVYQVPLIPPVLAAYLATGVELIVAPLLILGLATRISALAMLGMTAVIQIFVFPNAYADHSLWAVSLLLLLKYGAGPFSLDYWISKFWESRHPPSAHPA